MGAICMPLVFGCEPCSRWACVMITRAQSRVFITALASDTRRWSSTGTALTRRVGAEPAGVDTAKALVLTVRFCAVVCRLAPVSFSVPGTKPTDLFGNALSSAGNILVVGAPRADASAVDQGLVYVRGRISANGQSVRLRHALPAHAP